MLVNRSMPTDPGPGGSRARRGGAAALLAAALLATGGCARDGDATPARKLTFVDSVLTELGGVPTADLTRGQRWRMISSMGVGLPPSTFAAASLPDPNAPGAVLLQAYCARCHGLPAPQMHAAEEWPILVRRMLLRARTLESRMGGPITEGALGDILLTGMASADVPGTGDVETIVAYLQDHALPTADPATLGEGADVELFVRTCSQCHETPAPSAHTADEWEAVVSRMRANTALMDVPQIPDTATERVLAYLRSAAGR